MDQHGGEATQLNQLHDHVRVLELLLRRRFLALGVDAELGPRLGHEAGSLLDELGDLLDVPLFVAGPDGALEFVNRALDQLLGRERPTVETLTLSSLLPGWTLDDSSPEATACLLEVRGETLPVRIRTRMLREGDEVLAVLGTVEDQSPHLRAMEALRQSEIRYHGLFEEALDAIFLMDGDRFMECNSAAGRMFGRTPGQLAGLRPLELSPPLQRDGRPSDQAARERIEAAHKGIRQHFEWLHCRQDGGSFDAEVSLSPLEVGGRRLLLAIVRDVTDRKYAEAALKASEEFNRGMIQHAPMGVMYVDPSGVLVYENPAMERMMGVPRDQASRALGRCLTELPGMSGLPLADLLEQVGRGEVVRNLEVDYTSIYGVRSQLLVQISPHRDAEGRVVGSIFMVQDVTELRNLEQQLRQAQKLDAIGSLAGGLAHDFNNLLTGISGNAELALQHLQDPGEVRRLLQDQVQICQRASDLTRRLLAFSRQEELSPRPMVLQRLLDDLENMLRRLLGETIHLDWSRSGEVWAVRADPGQMEQVVLNLVVNARDAMPDGGTLSMRVRNVELGAVQARRVMNLAPGPYVQLEVSDSGHGIDEALQGRIFEPFFTTKALGKGTGLGLSIVYAIVKKCGGAVTVESSQGSGTRFRLYFPSLGPMEVRQPEAAPEAGGLPRGHETILVLEDEPAVRDLSVRLLEHCGYRVLSAGSGAEALELAATMDAPADLIFSDVIMPGMSGPAAVRRLLELWPQVRVLFCSGYTDGELSRHDLSPAQGAPLLGKPFTLDTLCRNVRQVLDGPATPKPDVNP
jgi:two-component system cell cycle sensor histidine kinase/response regulator CckA